MIKYLRYIIATEFNGGDLSVQSAHMYRSYSDARKECDWLNKRSDYTYDVFEVTLEKIENGNTQKY